MSEDTENHSLAERYAALEKRNHQLETELRDIKNFLGAYDYSGNDRGYDLQAFMNEYRDINGGFMQSWKFCQYHSDVLVALNVVLKRLARTLEKDGSNPQLLSFCRYYAPSIRAIIKVGLRIHPEKGRFFGHEPQTLADRTRYYRNLYKDVGLFDFKGPKKKA